MSFHIVILPSAKSDIQRAAIWYEGKEIGLGKKLKYQIVKAIDLIGDPVRGYAPVYMNLSRVFVEKFPYIIYFKSDERRQRIVVYALLH